VIVGFRVVVVDMGRCAPGATSMPAFLKIERDAIFMGCPVVEGGLVARGAIPFGTGRVGAIRTADADFEVGCAVGIARLRNIGSSRSSSAALRQFGPIGGEKLTTEPNASYRFHLHLRLRYFDGRWVLIVVWCPHRW